MRLALRCRPGRARRLIRGVTLAAVAAALPFAVLLRGAIWLHGTGWGAWPSLALGALLSWLVLAGYALVATRWLTGRFRPPKLLLRSVAVLVAAYCAYGLVFLSADHASDDGVRAEYRSLHPMLRMAVGTLVLGDGGLLVTDAARVVEDYAAMGLPPNAGSLHLEQADGWVRAIDLRTRGRSSLRNGVTRLYFASLGFRTLRHEGTADHLHVSLP